MPLGTAGRWPALLAALERARRPREYLVERDLQPPVAPEEEQQAKRDEHGA